MDTNQKISQVGVNIQEKAAVIWNVANSLFGAYKPHEYGLVILPMVVIKRFHDCLLLTHDAVVAMDKRIKEQGLAVKDPFLLKASGYKFYNTSEYTFEKLKADPDNIKVNFESYLNGFSDNVMDILARMDFFTQLERMANAGLLYQVISDFCSDKADMNPDKISAVDMGYIFENLVQRFSESYDEEAGAHFTSRDIIYLMCDLLTDNMEMAESGRIYTVYDMAMGTSQMLTCMEERLSVLDKAANLICYGQEINPFTFGIAKADMLIRGGDPNNMQFGNTLSDDKFGDMKFDFIISNPPFGIDWKREAVKVEEENKLGSGGRFAPGLPPKSDGQMLFLMNGIAKLKDTGYMAIIQNGSSLFTGDAGSGPSNIRQYIIQNDWFDAIIQLPNDSFYNTGIATYIWLVTKNKPVGRREQIQLIDASKCFVPRRKPIGNKRVDITQEARNLIVKAYGEYKDSKYETVTENGHQLVVKSRILPSLSFGYNKITVETPLTDESGTPILKKGKIQADPSKRDTENIPLTEDTDEYFNREVLPYNPSAWIDHSKDKVGYEIPFTRTFYEYKMLEPAADIAARIEKHEKTLISKLQALFGNGGVKYGE